MCGLCGSFGIADHWTDGSGQSRAETQHRVTVANRFLALYGLKLAVWSGRFMLTGPTGGSAVVEHLGALWPAAEKLIGRPCDPLDPDFIDSIEAGAVRR